MFHTWLYTLRSFLTDCQDHPEPKPLTQMRVKQQHHFKNMTCVLDRDNHCQDSHTLETAFQLAT
eukprot:1293221-Amphidinium_carterae.1